MNLETFGFKPFKIRNLGWRTGDSATSWAGESRFSPSLETSPPRGGISRESKLLVSLPPEGGSRLRRGGKDQGLDDDRDRSRGWDERSDVYEIKIVERDAVYGDHRIL